MGSPSALGAATANLAINAGALDLNGNSLTVGLLTGSSGAVIASSSNAAVNLTVGASGTGTYAGVINNGSGTIALIKAGAGTLTLSGNNTFTGNIDVNAGRLILSNAANLYNYAVARTFTIASNSYLQLAANMSVGATASPGITFAGNGTLEINPGASSTVALGVYSTNYVVLAMSGGVIDVQSGSLRNGAYGNQNWTTNKASLNIAAGAAFQPWNGGSVFIDTLTGAGTVGGANNSTTGTGLTLGINDGTGTFSGSISNIGGGAIVKTGSGTEVFSGTGSTFTGKTSIKAGTLSVVTLNSVTTGTAASSSLGAPSSVANGAIAIGSSGTGAMLVVTGPGEITDRVIDLAGTTGGATIDQSGPSGLFSFTSSLTASGAGSKTLTLQGSTTGVGEIAGSIGNNSGTNKTAVLKQGTGTWTLSGSNTYSGGTTVANGTLKLGNASALGTGALSVVGGTLDMAGNNAGVGALSGSSGALITNSISGTSTLAITFSTGTSTFAASIADGSGVIALTKSGAGTLMLTGSNAYSGMTSINGGILNVGNANALAGSASLVFGGGTLQYSAANSMDYSGLIAGSGSAISIDTNGQDITFGTSLAASNTGGLAKSGNGTLTLNASNAFSGATTVTGGTLQIGNGGATGSIAGNVANSGVLAFNRSDRITFSGSISGTGAIQQIGSGSVMLTGSNNFTGAATAASGTLQIGDGSSGSVSGGMLTASAGGTVAIDLANGGTLGSAITNNGTVNFIAGGTNTISTNIYGWTSGVINQSGSGTTILSGNNDFAGTTNLINGVLQLNSQYAAYLSTENVGITNGLAFGANAVTLGGLSGSTGISIFTTSGSALNLSVGNNNSDTLFTGNLTGTNSSSTLAKVGNGTLTLGGSNSFAGATTATSGTLLLANQNAVEASNVTLTGSGAVAFDSSVAGHAFNFGGLSGSNGLVLADNSATPVTLTVGGNNSAGTYSGVLGGAGSIIKTGTGTLTFSGSNTFTGNITVNSGRLTLGSQANLSGVNLARTFTISAGAALQVGASISLGGSSAGITIAGSGTWEINPGASGAVGLGAIAGNNVILGMSGGVIDIQTGALRNGGYTAQNWTSNKASLNIAAGAAFLPWNGAAIFIDALTGAGAVGGSGNSIPGTGLTLGINNGSGTFSGAISNLGAGAIVKAGTGTQVLSGTGSAFAGKTSIKAGTLSVVTLNSVATGTAASSSLGAPSTVANGTIAIGSSGTSATLVVTGNGETTDRVLDLAGTTGGATIDQSGASGLLKFTSALTASGSGSKTLTLQGSTTAGGEIAGSIVDYNSSNKTAVLKQGSGTWALSGSNSYSGGTTVNGGTLQLGNANALGASTAGLIVNNGTLDLNGNSASVAMFSGTGANSLVTNSTSGTSTLTAAVTGGTSAYAGNIANGNGAVALTKEGAGTLVLSGSLNMAGLNANSGVTQLAQSGSIGAVNIASGATVTVAAHIGGTHNVLDTSSLAFSGTTGSVDILALDDLQINGGLTIMINDNSQLFLDSFAGGGGLGSFDEVTSAPVDSNQAPLKGTYLGDLNGDADGVPLAPVAAPAPTGIGSVAASPEAVPEPGMLGLLLAGALGSLGFRRRAKHGSR